MAVSDPSIYTGPPLDYQTLQNQMYQAAQNPNQQVIPFPGTWQGGEQPAIVSPYMDWDKQVWIVTKVDAEGMGWPRGVFSKETEAEKFAAAINCDQYEYIDVTPFELDQEVVVDEPKK